MISKLQGIECTLGEGSPAAHDRIVSTLTTTITRIPDLHTLTRFLRFCRCFACWPRAVSGRCATTSIYVYVIGTSGDESSDVGGTRRRVREFTGGSSGWNYTNAISCVMIILM